ncbi:MAG: hypothetical protein ABUT20_27990, partial [Bacteroidota bacterium]
MQRNLQGIFPAKCNQLITAIVCPILLIIPFCSKSQNKITKGLPFITNYRYQDYNADGVNWWAAEDDKGVMYFANTSGTLIYDGQNWELIKP